MVWYRQPPLTDLVQHGLLGHIELQRSHRDESSEERVQIRFMVCGFGWWVIGRPVIVPPFRILSLDVVIARTVLLPSEHSALLAFGLGERQR